MQKTDLLSIEVGSDWVHISSTDPMEVKYFGQLLVEKYGAKHYSAERLLLYQYHASYSGSELISDSWNPKPNQIYNRDVRWWLFRSAIEKGWEPFSEVGTFTRHVETESFQ